MGLLDLKAAFCIAVLSGTFILVNRHLVKKLIKLNLWNEEMRKKIILQNGSIQNIPEIPTDLKEIYKVSHEVKQKNMATSNN